MSDLKDSIAIDIKAERVIRGDDPQRQVIRDRLREWTRDAASEWEESRPERDLKLTITMTDKAGEVVGGMFGDAFLGCLCVYRLWVADAWRGKGLGIRLMALVEEKAREAGCSTMQLDTFDFQAPRFYEKLGFEEFGRFRYFPDGPEKVFLFKKL